MIVYTQELYHVHIWKAFKREFLMIKAATFTDFCKRVHVAALLIIEHNVYGYFTHTG